MWGYECSDGNWEQVNLRGHKDITVPTATGENVVIEQLNAEESVKTLGLFTNPEGCCKNRLTF